MLQQYVGADAVNLDRPSGHDRSTIVVLVDVTMLCPRSRGPGDGWLYKASVRTRNAIFAEKVAFSLFADDMLTQRVAGTGAAAVHVEFHTSPSWQRYSQSHKHTTYRVTISRQRG